MKAIQRILSLIFVGAMLVFFIGCERENRANLEMEIDQLERQIQSEIDRIDARISELNREMQDAGEEAKAEMNEQIDNLEGLRNDLSDELQRLRNATQDQLDQIKMEFEELRMEIDEAININIDEPETEGAY